MIQALLHPDAFSSLTPAVSESCALLDGILKGEGIGGVLRERRRMISLSQQSVIPCLGVHFGPLWKPCFLSFTPANGVLRNGQDRLHHRTHLIPHCPHGCHDHSVSLQVRPRAEKGTGKGMTQRLVIYRLYRLWVLQEDAQDFCQSALDRGGKFLHLSVSLCFGVWFVAFVWEL